MRKRTPAEIKRWIVRNLDVIEVPDKSFSASFKSILIENVILSALNREYNISEDDVDFTFYRLMRTKRNALLSDNRTQPLYYIIVENTTGYISTDSTFLFDLLVVYRGIDEHDYETKNCFYAEYADCLSNLLNRLSSTSGVR